jgi:hypothetical protein
MNRRISSARRHGRGVSPPTQAPGRAVAIVLPDCFARIPTGSRHWREARTSSPDHPNIAFSTGLEQRTSCTPVMELVEGEDLGRAARACRSLAEALPSRARSPGARNAHEAGIIHRSRRRTSGVKATAVKVLDFGLAKAVAPDGGGRRAP